MRLYSRLCLTAACAAVTTLTGAQAGATTIAQNSAWNVTRGGATETLRIVAYGDSIYAGYTSATTIARRAGPHVGAEYGAALWGQNIEVRRRAQSGALASGIYNRINSATDRAFMQTPNTRVVTFAMCGNDYLQARSAFAGQTGTCNYAPLENAFQQCRLYTELAIQNINQNAHPNVKLKIVGNLYYPGYDSDNVQTNCTDPDTGERFNRRDKFLPLLARSNFMTCELARQYGWQCADNFAEYMAADIDTDGDGIVDAEAIRYRPGESEESYVNRISQQYRHTLRDANFKRISATTQADYLLTDNTHATFVGPTASALFTTPGGNVPVFFTVNGPYPLFGNPNWNTNGSDRMGFELARPYDLNVQAGPDATILACERYQGAVRFEDRVFSKGSYQFWVDYGDGAGEDGSTDPATPETFPLSNQYTVAGSYTVDVQVEGPYETQWSDTAMVTVRTAGDAVQDLLARLDELRTSGAISRGTWNGSRQPLIMAKAKLDYGQVSPAQSMIGDFITSFSTAPVAPDIRDELTAYAQRALAAAACNPVPRGEPPFGRPKPDRNAAKPQLPDLPEQLWVEVDGVIYDEDDPRLLDLFRSQLGLN